MDLKVDIGSINIETIKNVAITYSLKVLVAVLIFVAGLYLSKIIGNLTAKICIKARIDETLSIFLSKVVKTLILIVAFIAALSHLGIDTSSFVAILATSSLAIGLAFKDNMSNVGAGVVLIFLRPYKVGDSVETSQGAGIVEEISLFYTLIRTAENDVLIVPNAKFINDKIKNASVKNDRCIIFEQNVNAEKVEETLAYLNEQIKLISSTQAPFVGISSNNGSTAVVVLKIWIKNDDKFDDNLTNLNVSINPILQHLKTFA